jgi:hypothetical protein
MYKGKYEHKHSHIRKRTIIITVLIVLLFTVGGVFAKYIYNSGGMGLLSAKEFYFTSNLLTENTAKYVLNSKTTEISFTLGNNADKLRFSQDNIKYSIMVECKSGDSYPEENIKYADSEQVLSGGSVDTTSVTLEGLTMGETYIVTATGRAGYKQTLKAEFTVSDKEENVYMHLDTSNDALVLLTVWTHHMTGPLTVITPAGLIPDNTDPILRKVYNYSGTEYGAVQFTDNTNFTEAYSSYTYRFFISEDKSYDINKDFNVFIKKNDIEYPAKAEEKIPN